MNILIFSGVIVLVLLAILGGLNAYGKRRWTAATRDLVAQLEASRVPPATTRYNEAELANLPAPVQRYFRAVLPMGNISSPPYD